MNEPDCVPDDIVEIPQVHCLARLIEPERKRDGQAGAACWDLLVRTLHVLEMMREDIDQFEFKRFLAPVLADNRGALPSFLGGAINGMEDRDASKIRMANRAAVAVEVVEGGIDDDLQIPRECFHSRILLLITDFINSKKGAMMTDTDTADQLPTEIAPANRLLTAAEFHRLADVPPEVEWFANLSNPSTRRAYENAIRDFMRFTGIARPESIRIPGVLCRDGLSHLR